MPTEDITSALARLNAEGFTDSCRVEEDGIHFTQAKAVHSPEALAVEQVIRLEGTSAPDEQTAVFALRSQDGAHKGTFCHSYSPTADALDADAAQRFDASQIQSAERGASSNLQQQF